MTRVSVVLIAITLILVSLTCDAFVFRRKMDLIPPITSKYFSFSDFHTNNPMGSRLNLANVKAEGNLEHIVKSKSNLNQRISTGLALGAVGLVFLYSPKNIFTAGLSLVSLLALREYSDILKKVDVRPSMTLGALVGLASAFTAGYKFKFHSLVMPTAASVLLTKVFLSNSKLPTIGDVASEFFGWFYVAFLPSYWILLKFLPPSVMSSICRPEMLDNLDRGFLLTFFSMATVAFSDIGGYVGGRLFGHHKLSILSRAAGEASPNKTLQGACIGILSGCAVSLLGAYLMSWPHWPVTGLLYGLMLSVVGIVGDLTASMMKRNAGVKDSGSLLPGHGGVLDRVDSYMLTAPLAFAFCRYFLPPFVTDANW